MRWIICRARCSSSTCRSSSSSASAPSSRSSCASPPDLAFLRLVFAGTPEFAERALARLLQAGHDVALVLTQPDRPAGRGLKAAMSPVKRFALGRNLEVFQPHSLKTDGSARIRAARPDALVVAAYGLILPQAVLDVAAHGALNIHASLLPRWRGAAPIQRAILAGDAQTGVSIMQMDAGLDTGAVLAQSGVPIAPDDDAGTLHDKLAALGAEMIVATLADVQAGRGLPVAPPPQGVTYARQLGKRGARLGWAGRAGGVERAGRAVRPSPGAATVLAGAPPKVWRLTVTCGRGTPGELLSSSG